MPNPNEDPIETGLHHLVDQEEIDELNGGHGGAAITKPVVTGDQGAGAGDGDDDDDGDDEQSSSAKRSEEELEAGTEEERAAIRAGKKSDRLNQRQRARARIENLERQLANLLSSKQDADARIAQLEGRNVSSEIAGIEAAESQAAQAELQLKDIIADASVKGDGIRVAEATQGLLEVMRRKEQIAEAKANLRRQAATPRAQPLDNETVNHAKAFLSKNPWFKGPKATDPDSRVLASLDNSLTAEGWDPRSASYWVELETRAKKYIGHRFEKQNDTNGQGSGYNASTDRRPRSPVATGSSNSNGGGGKSGSSIRLSRERVEALKEAGMWDDLELRAKMIKRYQDLDKANPN